MALIKCPECGRENVSERAEFCPGCGFNIIEYIKALYVEDRKQVIKRKYKKTKIIVCLIALFAILVIVFSIFLIANKTLEKNAIISIQKFNSIKWGTSKDDVHSIYGTPKKSGYAKITNYNFWGENDITYSQYYELYDARICNKSGELYVEYNDNRSEVCGLEWKCKFSSENKAKKYYEKLVKLCEKEFSGEGEEATWGENLYDEGVAWISQSFKINDYYIQVFRNGSEVLLLFDTEYIWNVKSKEL